jgi:PAS domain S-box-containing protein
LISNKRQSNPHSAVAHVSDPLIVRQVRQNPSEAFDERPVNRRLSAHDLQGRAFTLLEEVGAAIANESNLNTIIRIVVEATSQRFGYAMTSIYLLEADLLVLQHDVGYNTVVNRLPITRGVMGEVARSGRARLIEDPSEFEDFIYPVDGVTSEVCVPLFDGGKVAGVLNVETVNEDRLGPHDLRLLAALADKVSVALSRSRLLLEARESERRYRLLLENLKEIIFETDHSGRLSFLNPAWKHVTGFEVGPSLGRNLLEFFTRRTRTPCASRWASCSRVTIRVFGTRRVTGRRTRPNRNARTRVGSRFMPARSKTSSERLSVCRAHFWMSARSSASMRSSRVNNASMRA